MSSLCIHSFAHLPRILWWGYIPSSNLATATTSFEIQCWDSWSVYKWIPKEGQEENRQNNSHYFFTHCMFVIILWSIFFQDLNICICFCGCEWNAFGTYLFGRWWWWFKLPMRSILAPLSTFDSNVLDFSSQLFISGLVGSSCGWRMNWGVVTLFLCCTCKCKGWAEV